MACNTVYSKESSTFQEDRIQIRYSRYIVLQLLLPAAKYYIVNSIPGLFQYNQIANVVLGIIFLAYFTTLVPNLYRNNRNVLILSTFILLCIYLFTFTIGAPNWINLKSASIDLILVSYTLFVVSCSIKDGDEIYRLLCKYAPFIILLSLMYFISTMLFHRIASDGTSYDMSSSYFCLVPTVICFSAIKKQKTVFNICCFITGLLVSAALGARGSLVGVAFFVLLSIIKNTGRSKQKIASFVIVVIVLLLFVVFYSSLSANLYEFLISIGINSRSLGRIISGGFFRQTSNRILIAAEMMDIINMKPLGIGFMGDLRSHNILIENFLWFGWVLGLAMNIFFLITAYTIIFRTDMNNNTGIVLVAIAAYAIPDALLNLTVWGKDYYWVMVGMMFAFGFSNLRVRLKIRKN